MRVTYENIITLPVEAKEQGLLNSLLIDIDEINESAKQYMNVPIIYIDWQDYHNEYSPERVDPCPDYYGYYTIRTDDDILGVEMDIDDLDLALCILYNYVVK